jgi:hypothetical protein
LLGRRPGEVAGVGPESELDRKEYGQEEHGDQHDELGQTVVSSHAPTARFPENLG